MSPKDVSPRRKDPWSQSPEPAPCPPKARPLASTLSEAVEPCLVPGLRKALVLGARWDKVLGYRQPKTLTRAEGLLSEELTKELETTLELCLTDLRALSSHIWINKMAAPQDPDSLSEISWGPKERQTPPRERPVIDPWMEEPDPWNKGCTQLIHAARSLVYSANALDRAIHDHRRNVKAPYYRIVTLAIAEQMTERIRSFECHISSIVDESQTLGYGRNRLAHPTSARVTVDERLLEKLGASSSTASRSRSTLSRSGRRTPSPAQERMSSSPSSTVDTPPTDSHEPTTVLQSSTAPSTLKQE